MYLSAPMKFLTLILSALLLIEAPQQDARSFWDRVLDKYETLCEACLNHKSTREINSLSKEFNELLKSPVGKMDAEQTKRFVSIQNRYKGIITVTDIPAQPERGSLIKVDTIRRVEHIQVVDTAFIKEILGQVEILQTSVSKDTIVHLIQYKQSEKAAEPAPEPAQTALTPSYFILASAGIVPDLSYGATLGTLAGRWGGYIKFRSNYNFKTKDYECNSRGETSGGTIWTNGQSSVSRLTATIGAAFAATPWLVPYVGAGYGFSDLFWQDFKDRWARVSDVSCSGVSLDLGVVAHFENLALSAGANCTGFKYFDLELGIGVFF